MNFPFILIDDDISIVESLEIVIRKLFPNAIIHKAFDGNEGLKLIKTVGFPSVIFCDLQMPGYSGMEILDRIRAEETLKYNYFVLCTAQAEKEISLKAMQKGADDILHKPLSMEEIISRLRVISRIVNTQFKEVADNSELINQKISFQNDLKVLATKFNAILKPLMPDKIARIDRVVETAKWIATYLDKYDEQAIANLEVAANIIYLGNLGLNRDIINQSVTQDGFLADPKFANVAFFPQEILGNIEYFSEVKTILGHIYENLDGSGFPDKQKAWMIHKSSRLLRVLKDYEQLIIDDKVIQSEAIDMLFAEAKRIYDIDIITLLDQYLANFEQNPTMPEQKVEQSDMREGMVISRTVITLSGLVLVPKRSKLNNEIIRKIKSIIETDSIIGSIYIYKTRT